MEKKEKDLKKKKSVKAKKNKQLIAGVPDPAKNKKAEEKEYRQSQQVFRSKQLSFFFFHGMLLEGLPDLFHPAHIWLEHFRDLYASVSLKVILQEGDQHPWRSDYGIV